MVAGGEALTQSIIKLRRAFGHNPWSPAYIQTISQLRVNVRLIDARTSEQLWSERSIGEPAKAIPLLRTAMRLNPEGGYLYFQILGRAYLFENDIEQALINLREASARNPVDVETRVYLAAAMVAAGDRFGAEWEAEEIRALDGGFSMRKWLEAYPMTSARHKARLSEALAQVGL